MICITSFNLWLTCIELATKRDLASAAAQSLVAARGLNSFWQVASSSSSSNSLVGQMRVKPATGFEWCADAGLTSPAAACCTTASSSKRATVVNRPSSANHLLRFSWSRSARSQCLWLRRGPIVGGASRPTVTHTHTSKRCGPGRHGAHASIYRKDSSNTCHRDRERRSSLGWPRQQARRLGAGVSSETRSIGCQVGAPAPLPPALSGRADFVRSKGYWPVHLVDLSRMASKHARSHDLLTRWRARTHLCALQ